MDANPRWVRVVRASYQRDVTGTVHGATGGVVPGAAISAQNEATGVKAATVSGANGVCHFNNLPVGSYTVTAAAPTFATSSVRHVSVVLSNVITTNMTLQIGSTATTIEVSESAAPIDITTGQLQSTFEPRQAVELPSAGLSTD